MAKRRLTNSEREIRRSAGLPLVRVLQFLVPIVSILIMASDRQMFVQCLGHDLPPAQANRGAAFVHLVIALGCSPYYLANYSQHWINISVFVFGVGLSVVQYFWIKKHKTYWDAFREKQRLKRIERAVAVGSTTPTEPSTQESND